MPDAARSVRREHAKRQKPKEPLPSNSARRWREIVNGWRRRSAAFASSKNKLGRTIGNANAWLSNGKKRLV